MVQAQPLHATITIIIAAAVRTTIVIRALTTAEPAVRRPVSLPAAARALRVAAIHPVEALPVRVAEAPEEDKENSRELKNDILS